MRADNIKEVRKVGYDLGESAVNGGASLIPWALGQASTVALQSAKPKPVAGSVGIGVELVAAFFSGVIDLSKRVFDGC